MQGHINKPFKHSKRRFLQKQSTAFSRQPFSCKAPSQTFHQVENMSPQRGDHNVWKQPIVYSLPSSRLPAINLVRKEISSSIPRYSALSDIAFEDATKRLKEMLKKKP